MSLFLNRPHGATKPRVDRKMLPLLTLLLLTLLALTPRLASAQYAPITYPSGYFSNCNQYPHVWLDNPNGPSFVQGAVIEPTGVVAKRTSATFAFVLNETGQVINLHVTQPARKNCVIYQEPEAISTYNFPPGHYTIYASYWGYGPVIDQVVGGFEVRAYVPPVCNPDPQEVSDCEMYGGYWDWSSCSCQIYSPCVDQYGRVDPGCLGPF